jgi:molybdenum cofactor cytidylyltransferase
MTTEGRSSLALEAIVLAGGAGARFGGEKLTSSWRGGRLIDGALAAAFGAPVRSVTVVTGADAAVAPAALQWTARADQLHRMRIVHAADHAEGMAASLRTGIASLPADAGGAFVLLGDMPLVPLNILGRLAGALMGEARAVAPVFNGRRGHPVLFGAPLFPALLALKGDEGARVVLQSIGGALVTIETDDAGVVFDVDTREQS